MPLLRTALLATAACLIGAAAYAQPTTSDSSSMPSQSASPDTSTAPPADQAAPPADQSAAPAAAPSSNMSAAPTGAAANTSTTVDASGNQVIASQPVPDTPANRAAYGSPLSHAGKHTKPAGN